VLPARNRMTRSSEYSVTVRHGVRAAQSDLVVHALRSDASADGPRIGLVVGKSVGNAVQRHRVSRRLRHIARTLLLDLEPADLVVIRALPTSRHAPSSGLAQQLREALKRTRRRCGGYR
jgi:ribonuclease P protein component